MSNDVGRLIVVSGPTAAGKSTLWRRLVSFPGVQFSVSATTRPPRPGEVDGRDYHFVDEAQFAQMIERGELLEHALVHGRHYGTPRAAVVTALDAGHDVVLEIDVQGAEQLKDCGLLMVSIFVAPPSIDVLRQRLAARGTEDPEEMERRLSIVRQEMAHASAYDHVVINDDLERMVAEVVALLGLDGAVADRS